MKAKYWKKHEVPTEEGWYWCKYRGKHGIVICPCFVMLFKTLGFSVQTARNDIYSTNTKPGFGDMWFGAKIESPSLKG